MGNISNVRAYFQREYRDANGTWHKESVKEIGQFKPYDGKNHYYDYADLPSTQSYFYEQAKINNKWVLVNPKYTPSGAYFPEKFYQFSEIINDDDIDYLRDFLASGFNLYPTQRYTTYATFRSKRITFKTLKNWYVFPYFMIHFGSLNSFNERDAGMSLYMMTCKYPPEDIQYNDELKKWTHKVSDGVYSEMTYGRSYDTNGEYAQTFIDNMNILSVQNATLQECFLSFNENISNYKKVKFYPYLSGNANPFSFDNSLKQFYSNFQIKNYNVDITNSRDSTMFGLCFDTSNMNNVIEKCFNATGSLCPDLLTEYIYNPSEKAPDDKIPGIKDDPNDEDPGFTPSDPDPDYDENDRGGDGDHDDSSDIISIPSKPSLEASGVGLVTIWNPTSSQLENLGSKLWEPSAWEAIKQYFTNPLEAILGLSIIPVSPSFSSVSTIHLGGYDTKISSNIVASDYVDIDLGSIPINRYYGSYLDYDGFTKISCYLPYIGEVDINPDQVMTKTLGLKYRINVITGDCVAILSIDGSVFATYSGNCARQIPICQSDFSAIIQSSVSLITTIGVAVATGGASAGAAGATMQLGQAEAPNTSSPKATSLAKSLVSDVMSSKLSYKHASQLGLGAGQLSPQVPFLTITRPNLDLPESYKSFVGYPSNMNIHLGKCTGFTQVEAINLSVPSASQEELSEIIELLLAGVIF